MSEWRDIKTLPDDTFVLPKNGIMLWNTCDGLHYVSEFDLMKDHWWIKIIEVDRDDLYHCFSHWMPAPDGPEINSHLKLVS